MVNFLFFNRRFCARLCIVAALLLSGCAMPDMTVPDTTAARGDGELLRLWAVLTGARPGALLGGAPEGNGYVLLRYPTAVSARGNDAYVVDAGLRRIFRYSRIHQTLAQFTTLTPDVTTLAPDAGTGIYAAPDLSVYVTDPAGGQVLHFALDGAPLPPLVSRGNLARPVSVAVNENNGQVLVADGLYDQIIAFNSLGMTLSIIKPQQVRAIAAMTTGPDGIYVIDRLARQVVVLGWDGAFRYALGADDLGEPAAIAVSRDNLVFVGDRFDRTVKVYQNGLLAARPGSAVPGSFNGVAGLAVDGNLLYVTDSQNARLQIMQITP